MSLTMSPFLRRVLLADAVISGAAGLLMAAGAWLLAPWLELPSGLLFWAGIILFPFVALLIFMASSANPARTLLVFVVAVNALWVVASLGVLVSGLVSPNLLGTVFILAQAGAVAVFAGLQWAALRHSPAVHQHG